MKVGRKYCIIIVNTEYINLPLAMGHFSAHTSNFSWSKSADEIEATSKREQLINKLFNLLSSINETWFGLT